MEAVTDSFTKMVNTFYNSYIILFAVGGLLFYFVYFYLGNPDSSSEEYGLSDESTSYTSSIKYVLSFIITLLMLWIAVRVIQNMFDIDVIEIIQKIFSGKFEMDEIFNTKPIIKPVELSTQIGGLTGPFVPRIKHEEVFNVSNNKYTYNDAKAICSAYNSRLATYKEVEDSYNGGGEWCNYGWSDKQLALFPTQESTYNKLQNIKGHENDCGRPGVNGGFMENSDLKFGVNCYGLKPDMNKNEEKLMAAQQLYPKTQKDIDLEKRVGFWKENIDTVLVSPFNKTKWNRI
jgi:hypothetical protein